MKRRNSPSNIFRTKQLITQLEKLSALDALPSDIDYLAGQLINGVLIVGITLENEYIYRSRWHEKGALFSSVKELLNKEASQIIEKGRFNNSGESILYAAACELGAIIELRPHINKVFAITKIKRKENSNLMFFPIGFKDRFLPNSRITKNEELVRDYLHKIITKVVSNQNEYNQTIALARVILYKQILGWSDNYSAVAYPSVQSKLISSATTYNLAIRPEAFHHHYSVDSVSLYTLLHEPNCYRLIEINTGVPIDNDAISWKYSFNEMKIRVKNGLAANNEEWPAIIHLESML